MKMQTGSKRFEIRPITQADLDAVLEVYRQCEDFLALGPEPHASMQMVRKDIESSQGEGGVFCGIFTATGKMVGVIDYIPASYKGEADLAFLSLLMIAEPYRNQGLGKAALAQVEREIGSNSGVRAIRLGVQVNNPLAVRFWQKQGYRIISAPALQPDQTIAMSMQKGL